MDILDIKDSSELAKLISMSMINNPEEFSFIRFDKIEHSSRIFYNPDLFILGYTVEVSVNEEDSDKTIEEPRFVNLSEDDIDLIHDAYLKWQEWYDKEKSKKLLDIFKKPVIKIDTD